MVLFASVVTSAGQPSPAQHHHHHPGIRVLDKYNNIEIPKGERNGTSGQIDLYHS